MKTVLIIMAGGGIGAALRHLVGRGAIAITGGALPWGTLAVNVAGGLAMGLLAGFLARFGSGTGHDLRLFLGTGLLGGFTTFSAFSLEAANMIERGQIGLAAGYAIGSVVLSIAALFAGLSLVRGFA
ncbi:MAG: fluoride efflux transporter CrcB [Sphingomonadales bacterium]|nr:fluoride efflux transporter CrcB [Sphingomonadales bacterium]